QIKVIAEQTQVVLGASVADYLFYRLGPKDGSLASTLNIADRLASFVRKTFVVEARSNDCDCVDSWGCDEGSHCVQDNCSKSESWPQCGFLWLDQCSGGCYLGADG